MKKKDSISSIFDDKPSPGRSFLSGKKIMHMALFVLLFLLGLFIKYILMPNFDSRIFHSAVSQPSGTEDEKKDFAIEPEEDISQGAEIKERVKVIEGSIESLDTLPNNEDLMLDIPEIGM